MDNLQESLLRAEEQHQQEAAGLRQALLKAEEEAKEARRTAEAAVEAFKASPEFEEEALGRMGRLTDVRSGTDEGAMYMAKNGQVLFGMELHKAQETLLQMINEGKELPARCGDFASFDGSPYNFYLPGREVQQEAKDSGEDEEEEEEEEHAE